MVISTKDLKPKLKSLQKALDLAEELIDAELSSNAERLDQGRWVMIPCTMPFEYYTPLIERYAKKGWLITHEKINAYGRMYFSKKK